MTPTLVVATHQDGSIWYFAVPSAHTVDLLHALMNDVAFVADADTADWSILPGVRDYIRESIGQAELSDDGKPIVYEIGIIGSDGHWIKWGLPTKPGGDVMPRG